jgi:class 3 adenylate cyclase
LATRLADLLRTAQEVDLTEIRPLKLARLWQVPALQAVELCLEATRAGVLELRWDLLCPRCRIAKAVVGSLDQLPTGAHCGTCNIDYGRDFSQNVELSFRPAPAVRPLAVGDYCLFGPMSTPHIRVHVTLEPGASRRLAADLAPGPYRLRTLEPGPECAIDWPAGSGFPEVVATDEAVTAGEAAPRGEVHLRNDSGRRLTFVVEERAWVADALTADRATSLQTFRDLFSAEVLRPGDEVAVKRLALLFTDLKESTALYGAIGDASAYHLVREHFAYLAAIVRTHEGAIVKTIGDAILAAFVDPAEALSAAIEMQRRVASFNAGRDGPGIVLKVGLHEGPVIAVTLNDRLDYFGATVNLTARLQGESRGGDVVLSRAMAADPQVAALLAGHPAGEEQARLKGFERPVEFLRLTFDQKGC